MNVVLLLDTVITNKKVQQAYKNLNVKLNPSQRKRLWHALLFPCVSVKPRLYGVYQYVICHGVTVIKWRALHWHRQIGQELFQPFLIDRLIKQCRWLVYVINWSPFLLIKCNIMPVHLHFNAFLVLRSDSLYIFFEKMKSKWTLTI